MLMVGFVHMESRWRHVSGACRGQRVQRKDEN